MRQSERCHPCSMAGPALALPAARLAKKTSGLDGDFRGRAEQGLRVGMLGLFGHLSSGTGFDDLAPVHYGDAGGEIAHDRHGVRDEEVGEAEVALQLCEQVNDLGAHADIERGDGFVGHDEFRAQGQRAGDADALALASAELVWKAAAGGLVHAHGAQEFCDTSAAEVCAKRLVNEQGLGDHVLDTEAGIEGAERVLEDDLHVTAQAAHFAMAGGEQIMPIKEDAAGGGDDEPEHKAAQRTFARAGLADQAEGFSSPDGKRNVIDCAHFSVRAAAENRLAERESLG